MIVDFPFVAHRFGNTRRIRITIRIEDDPGLSFADLADIAEDRAYTRAARYFACAEHEVELVSD